ncbi:MAG: glycosyltransferase family 4 protein [Chloroflexi bacterium]|nr:glycosyltransferase family 4 protein [Chloroflexota bacterium]
MTPLHVGIDLSPLAFGNLMRGIGIYAENLLTALGEIDRSTPYVLFVANSSPFPSQSITWLEELPPNFRQVMIPMPPLGRAAALISHQVTLPAQVARLGLDVLHCIDTPSNPSHAGIPLWQSVPLVVTIHDMIPLILGKQGLLRWRHRLFYRLMLWASSRAAHLIADSHDTARQIVGHNLAPQARVTVAPLAAPRFTAPKRDKPCQRSTALADSMAWPFILHVGTADPSKNQQAVLKAFAWLCKDPGFQHRLILLGSHHCSDDIATSLEPRAAGRIMRLSNLPRADVRDLYQACTAFLFPSYYEGFGLPVLEAMSCGCPVVASSIPVIAEVAGDAALLVAPDDWEGLAGAVRNLLQDRALHDRYVEAGFRRAQQFSWSQTAQITREVYERTAFYSKRSRHGMQTV